MSWFLIRYQQKLPLFHSLAAWPLRPQQGKAEEGVGKENELRGMEGNRTEIALKVLHEGPQDLSDLFLLAFSRRQQVA